MRAHRTADAPVLAGDPAGPPAAGRPWQADARHRLLLRRVEALSDLPDEAIQSLACRAVRRHYPRGQTIFWQGDPGDHLYVVATGLVKLVRVSADGDELLLGVRGEGRMFGEIALFDHGERAAQAGAVRPSTLLVLPRSAIMEVVGRHPELTTRLLREVGLMVRDAIERAFDLVYLDLTGRVAKMLLQLPEPGQPVVELHLNQAELAALVGGSRPAVNQVLREFERRGYVKRTGRTLALLQPDRLRHRAGLTGPAS